ncbi:hypothetical protein [Novosphingobium colocasiae]|uniref:Glycerophosphotransferase n=1 Tax=Novosphingobium colocasiae TaxID=1256513 RepID=A0A918PCH4_9SPHN|nr:hypothetical protein [Novosphingobium colocasiae]GGY99226.1 glycerophosphotransferase [Novosphingobium colocasiae]
MNRAPPFRVAFLFNHEAVHQVRHTAPVAARLARYAGLEVAILSSSAAQDREARAIVGENEGNGPVRFRMLTPGPIARAAGPLLSLAGPFRRIAVLLHNRHHLAGYDAIVVPETTTMLLRDAMGVKTPKLIWIPHGAGDRSVGFRRIAARFDLVLVAGPKVRERMIAEGGVEPERCRIVGYPKFDTLDPSSPGPPLFANGRPTVVYNPHFDPRLSSWFEMGEAVLDWFAGQDRFNLVFAPHVMLFRRRIHASVEHRLLRWRGAVAARFRDHPAMLIDTGSARSTDMTYTRSADIYLGDASSQIYEWIARPRPAIFLNPRRIDWHDDPNFAHWQLGPVVSDIAGMAHALDAAQASPDGYAARQAEAFARTFSVESVPAAERAARALVDLLEAGCAPAR